VRTLIAFVLVGAALALMSLAAAGSERLWSPLTSLGTRGLQLEAYAALPFLWSRYLSADATWQVRYSPTCNCHEIWGPGVAVAVQLASVALAAGAIALVALHVRAFKAPASARTVGTAALLAALGIGVWLLAARVFSPQYLIWVLPLVALVEGRFNPLWIAVCVLTTLIYPFAYRGFQLYGLSTPDSYPLVFLALIGARNALLVAATAVALVPRPRTQRRFVEVDEAAKQVA
jgi:hypothetical protein